MLFFNANKNDFEWVMLRAFWNTMQVKHNSWSVSPITKFQRPFTELFGISSPIAWCKDWSLCGKLSAVFAPMERFHSRDPSQELYNFIATEESVLNTNALNSNYRRASRTRWDPPPALKHLELHYWSDVDIWRHMPFFSLVGFSFSGFL